MARLTHLILVLTFLAGLAVTGPHPAQAAAHKGLVCNYSSDSAVVVLRRGKEQVLSVLDPGDCSDPGADALAIIGKKCASFLVTSCRTQDWKVNGDYTELYDGTPYKNPNPAFLLLVVDKDGAGFMEITNPTSPGFDPSLLRQHAIFDIDYALYHYVPSSYEDNNGRTILSPAASPPPPGSLTVPGHPIDPACVDNLDLTVAGLPDKWQTAVRSAATTWSQAGSRVKVNTTTAITDTDRTIAPEENKVDLGLPLAACEVRVELASALPEEIQAAHSQDAIWSERFTIKGYTAAALLFFNDVEFTWSQTKKNPDPSRLDVETGALYELGHVLAIGDLPNGPAVMSAAFRETMLLSGKADHNLRRADILALLSLYGGRKPKK